MATRGAPAAPSLDVSIVIAAPKARVLQAFFEADALKTWLQAANAFASARLLSPYIVEWKPTDFRDDILGRLGGVLKGTVVEFRAGRGFFVADTFWMPPDGDPIGPMAFEVACTEIIEGTTPSTRLRVTQCGFVETPRWRRYYEVIGPGWERALGALKSVVEKTQIR